MKTSSFVEYRNKLCQSKTAVMVGGGITPFNYDELCRITTPIIMVNWALILAQRLTHSQTAFYLSWHMDVFQQRYEFTLPQVIPVTAHSDHLYLPPGCGRKNIRFKAVNIAPYDKWISWINDKPTELLDSMVISRSEQLFSCCNTTLLAMHFAYYMGVRRLYCIGMHDLNGELSKGYDPRLMTGTAEHVNDGSYKRSQDDFANALGITIHYVSTISDIPTWAKEE